MSPSKRGYTGTVSYHSSSEGMEGGCLGEALGPKSGAASPEQIRQAAVVDEVRARASPRPSSSNHHRDQNTSPSAARHHDASSISFSLKHHPQASAASTALPTPPTSLTVCSTTCHSRETNEVDSACADISGPNTDIECSSGDVEEEDEEEEEEEEEEDDDYDDDGELEENEWIPFEEESDVEQEGRGECPEEQGDYTSESGPSRQTQPRSCGMSAEEQKENGKMENDGAGQDGSPLLTESEDEGKENYRKGGYHPVHIGEIYKKRYKIIKKLGWGHFSTVWLCHDLTNSTFVALKVQKSADHYTEAAYDEIHLLVKSSQHNKDPTWIESQEERRGLHPFDDESTSVTQLLDYFEHNGPHGKHMCMVFETLGPNVLTLIQKYDFKGIPLDLVRKITSHTLIGLDYLHRIPGIIHTDLKPENILVACPLGVPVDKTGVPLVDSNMLKKAEARRRRHERACAAEAQEKKGVNLENLVTANGVKLPNKKEMAKMTKSERRKWKKRREEAEQQTLAKLKQERSSEWAEVGTNSEDFTSDEEGKEAGRPAYTAPPFVKDTIKPSRSDPCLLSSYVDSGDMFFYKRPYHYHIEDILQHSRAEKEDLEKKKKKFQEPEALTGELQTVVESNNEKYIARQRRLREELDERIKEVKQLDLFDHPTVNYVIADLGNACWINKHFSEDIQTRQYRSPEVIIGAWYDTSADLWSLACIVFELMTGDYLFDPNPSEEYTRDEEHLALTIELLGKLPPHLVKQGRLSKSYFNAHGDLRHIKNLDYWILEERVITKYKFLPWEARNVASFLLPMLNQDPGKRFTARQMLQHPWLRGQPSQEVLDSVRLPWPLSPGSEDYGEQQASSSSFSPQHQQQQQKQQYSLASDYRYAAAPNTIPSADDPARLHAEYVHLQQKEAQYYHSQQLLLEQQRARALDLHLQCQQLAASSSTAGRGGNPHHHHHQHQHHHYQHHQHHQHPPQQQTRHHEMYYASNADVAYAHNMQPLHNAAANGVAAASSSSSYNGPYMDACSSTSTNMMGSHHHQQQQHPHPSSTHEQYHYAQHSARNNSARP